MKDELPEVGPGQIAIAADDGLGFHLEARRSTCVDRDACIGVNELEDGGRPTCTLGKYSGPIKGLVSLRELPANPKKYEFRDVVVDGRVSTSGRIALLHVKDEQPDGSAEATAKLISMDDDLHRRIRACDGVVLRVSASVLFASANSVDLEVHSVGRP